jgi:hypothetical protein
MEIWKTLRVSHIPTPPATTTDKCLTRRYTNTPLGTKDRSGHPNGTMGARYSFRGNIKGPHTVLEGGYVSFGNPVDNNWYQIIVVNGQTKVRDLGVIQSSTGRSLRELVDFAVRKSRKKEHYRFKPAMTKAMAASAGSPLAKTNAARAKTLRNYVEKLRLRDVA